MRLNFRVRTAAGLMHSYHTMFARKLILLFFTAALAQKRMVPIIQAHFSRVFCSNGLQHPFISLYL